MKKRTHLLAFCLTSIVLLGCPQDDPEVTDAGTTPIADAGANSDAGSNPDNGTDCQTVPNEDMGICSVANDAYLPRQNNSADDSWDACISDDNTYHLAGESTPSSVARVEAYDRIGALLWDHSITPPADNFVQAKLIYAEDSGVGSRVARRYDTHYPKPPNGESCQDEGVPAQYPDYCVGPATLEPIINEAFLQGGQGNDPALNSARIRAALMWFFYVSAVKEGMSCAAKAKDCDSSWAYHTGGTDRDNPIGLGRAIKRVAPETYNQAFDGNLAIRCWRDLDSAETAENEALQLRAVNQLDAALIQGFAAIIKDELDHADCSTGLYRDSALEFVRTVAPLFNRPFAENDPTAAAAFLAGLEGEVDVPTLTGYVFNAFNCN